jgi:hypothetical protein
MTITDAQLAALKALLTGDEQAFDRLLTGSDLARTQEFAVLTATALVLAVRRSFPPGWSPDDVVQFVACLRARDAGAHADVNPAAAEQMLLAVLRDERVSDDFDVLVNGHAQVALLNELVAGLDNDQMEDFLAETRGEASQWVQNQMPVTDDQTVTLRVA